MICGDLSDSGMFEIKNELRELIPHFVTHQFSELQLMERCLEKGDYKEIARLGHSLKGAAANFSLEPLRNLGSAIQDVSGLGMVEDLEPLVRKYRSYLNLLKDQIS